VGLAALDWHEAVDNEFASMVARLRALTAEANESPLKEEAEEKLREVIAGQRHAARGQEDARQKYRETVRLELELDRAFREDRIVRRRELSEVRALSDIEFFEPSWPRRRMTLAKLANR
jgi:hypothetical protein